MADYDDWPSATIRNLAALKSAGGSGAEQTRLPRVQLWPAGKLPLPDAKF